MLLLQNRGGSSLVRPLVSVIIPHYERPSLLADTIASVRASSDQRFEIIVVDDGSKGLDWKAARSLADDSTLVLQRVDGIKGPSRCRNLGLERALGEFVIFLDSDDLMAPWCLANRLSQVQSHPDADLWISPVLLFRDQPGDMDVLWNLMADGRDDVERFAQSDPPWHTSSPIWRTSAIRSIGGFNEAVFYGDDADLHLRALVSRFRVQRFPLALPDMFVRRSDAARITNSLTAGWVESRRARLREGTRFLKDHADRGELMSLWEGQYFMEAEFLLFNHNPAEASVRLVLQEWIADFSPSRWLAAKVGIYFSVALSAQKRAYIILRIARRVAMLLLPVSFFPQSRGFHTARVDETVIDDIHRLLLRSRIRDDAFVVQNQSNKSDSTA